MAGIEMCCAGKKISFGTMRLPNRKSKALYISNGKEIDVIAYFTSEKNADAFDKIIVSVVNAFNYLEKHPTPQDAGKGKE
ncbi:MAG TPA: hypothetical protein PLZ78_09050 [Spirochaetota bacterium]|nr:hypothetical protein [Spirochaetota bacterium]